MIAIRCLSLQSVRLTLRLNLTIHTSLPSRDFKRKLRPIASLSDFLVCSSWASAESWYVPFRILSNRGAGCPFDHSFVRQSTGIALWGAHLGFKPSMLIASRASE
eukprot:3309181-Amphidinium_carterae.1